MLLRILFSTLLLTAYSLVFGQDEVRREEAVTKLIQVQVGKASDLLDENTLNALTLRFRNKNPGVSEETWRQVNSDVKALFIRILSEPNGVFATAVRGVMPQFSTEEVEKLVAIHTDPLFIRYNETTIAALKQQKAQFAIRIGIERTVVEMNDLVIKRGLNPAY